MIYNKSRIDANINHDRVEFVENKVLAWLSKFWQFSLFYGDYLAGLHANKKVKSDSNKIN